MISPLTDTRLGADEPLQLHEWFQRPTPEVAAVAIAQWKQGGESGVLLAPLRVRRQGNGEVRVSLTWTVATWRRIPWEMGRIPKGTDGGVEGKRWALARRWVRALDARCDGSLEALMFPHVWGHRATTPLAPEDLPWPIPMPQLYPDAAMMEQPLRLVLQWTHYEDWSLEVRDAALTRLVTLLPLGPHLLLATCGPGSGAPAARVVALAHCAREGQRLRELTDPGMARDRPRLTNALERCDLRAAAKTCTYAHNERLDHRTLVAAAATVAEQGLHSPADLATPDSPGRVTTRLVLALNATHTSDARQGFRCSDGACSWMAEVIEGLGPTDHKKLVQCLINGRVVKGLAQLVRNSLTILDAPPATHQYMGRARMCAVLGDVLAASPGAGVQLATALCKGRGPLSTPGERVLLSCEDSTDACSAVSVQLRYPSGSAAASPSAPLLASIASWYASWYDVHAADFLECTCFDYPNHRPLPNRLAFIACLRGWEGSPGAPSEAVVGDILSDFAGKLRAKRWLLYGQLSADASKQETLEHSQRLWKLDNEQKALVNGQRIRARVCNALVLVSSVAQLGAAGPPPLGAPQAQGVAVVQLQPPPPMAQLAVAGPALAMPAAPQPKQKRSAESIATAKRQKRSQDAAAEVSCLVARLREGAIVRPRQIACVRCAAARAQGDTGDAARLCYGDGRPEGKAVCPLLAHGVLLKDATTRLLALAPAAHPTRCREAVARFMREEHGVVPLGRPDGPNGHKISLYRRTLTEHGTDVYAAEGHSYLRFYQGFECAPSA